MYFVYILKSKCKDWCYIGHTSNIQRRINEHNNGKNKSTKHYRPFSLLYKEQFTAKSDAFKREQQIKSYRHGEAFKRLVS